MSRPANISERVLREYFFPPFEAAVKRANAQAVMPSDNEILDGVPSHANAWLMNQILREEMGFTGRRRERLLGCGRSPAPARLSSPIACTLPLAR